MERPVVSRNRVITPNSLPSAKRVKNAVLYNASEDMSDPLFNEKAYTVWKVCLQVPDSRLKALFNKIEGADQKFSRFLHDLRSKKATPVRCELSSLEDRVYEWIASLCIYAKIDNLDEALDVFSERPTRVETGFEMIEKWGGAMTSIGLKLVSITTCQSSEPQKIVAIQAELREEILRLLLDLIPIPHVDKFKKCFFDLNKFLEELPISKPLDDVCSTLTDDHFRRTLLGWDKPSTSALSNTEEMRGSILDIEKYTYGSNLKKEVVAEVDQSAVKKSELDKVVSEFRNELSSMKGLIDTLDSKIHKLEKENALLRFLMVESSREYDVPQTSGALDNLSRLEGEVRTSIFLFPEFSDRFVTQGASSFDGYRIWKVSRIKQHRRNAESGRFTSIYSPPFYTAPSGGYKMSMQAYLNGEGEGKGSHLSIFFSIHRGNYDSTLRWPFDLTVTIRLIHQLKQEIKLQMSYTPDLNSSSTARPVNVNNASMGFPKFIYLDYLRNPGFVKDDVMFIGCKVTQ